MSEHQVRVPDNGWQLLIAIVAAEIAPDLVTVTHEPQERPVVREDCTTKGVTTTRYVQLSQEDVDMLAEGVDGYLVDAGVTPFARPAAVYLTLPPGMESMDELCTWALNELGPRELIHPSEWAAALREVLPRRYSRVNA